VYDFTYDGNGKISGGTAEEFNYTSGKYSSAGSATIDADKGTYSIAPVVRNEQSLKNLVAAGSATVNSEGTTYKQVINGTDNNPWGENVFTVTFNEDNKVSKISVDQYMYIGTGTNRTLVYVGTAPVNEKGSWDIPDEVKHKNVLDANSAIPNSGVTKKDNGLNITYTQTSGGNLTEYTFTRSNGTWTLSNFENITRGNATFNQTQIIRPTPVKTLSVNVTPLAYQTGW
jgi:hypothetical protein